MCRVRTPFGDLPAGWANRASMSEQHDYLQVRLKRRTLLKGAALASASAASSTLWLQSTAIAREFVTPGTLPSALIHAMK